MTIGGSLFAHNAIEFDYCLVPALDSLLPFCDQIAFVDAESTDGTMELVQGWATTRGVQAKLRVGTHPWACAKGPARLAVVANAARNLLSTDWHFMLQADEVIHENSYDWIRKCVAERCADAYAVRRYTLSHTIDQCVRVSLAGNLKPCNDTPVRLGVLPCPAMGDAESLGYHSLDTKHIDHIVLVHYSLVRRFTNFVKKVCDMQPWFFGGIDKRFVRAREQGLTSRPREIGHPDDYLMPLPVSHPAVAKDWVDERRREERGG